MTHKRQPVVIITGASGFLGSALVKHFTTKSWKVIGLVRNPEQQTKAANVEYVSYELGKPFAEETFMGADYLVHTAYVKYDRQHPDAMQVNITAAEQLLAASRKYGLAKNVFVSSMSAHENAVSVYGRQKLAVEALFSTKKDVALRSGLIIGYGGIVKQMMDFMRTKRLVPLIGGGAQPLQTIAVYDLVRCIEQSLTSNLHGRFTVATPTIYTYREFYGAIGERVGVKPLFLPVPFFALQTALKIASALHISLSVSEDNLLGLKKLSSAKTNDDLHRLGIKLDTLKQALDHTSLPGEEQA